MHACIQPTDATNRAFLYIKTYSILPPHFHQSFLFFFSLHHFTYSFLVSLLRHGRNGHFLDRAHRDFLFQLVTIRRPPPNIKHVPINVRRAKSGQEGKVVLTGPDNSVVIMISNLLGSPGTLFILMMTPVGCTPVST